MTTTVLHNLITHPEPPSSGDPGYAVEAGSATGSVVTTDAAWTPSISKHFYRATLTSAASGTDKVIVADLEIPHVRSMSVGDRVLGMVFTRNANTLVKARLVMTWLDADGDMVHSTSQAVTSYRSTAEWKALWTAVTRAADPGFWPVARRVQMVVEIDWNGAPISSTCDITAAMMLVEDPEHVTPLYPRRYFCGSTPNTDEWTYAWEGVAGESASIATRVPRADPRPIRRNFALTPRPQSLSDSGWSFTPAGVQTVTETYDSGVATVEGRTGSLILTANNNSGTGGGGSSTWTYLVRDIEGEPGDTFTAAFWSKISQATTGWAVRIRLLLGGVDVGGGVGSTAAMSANTWTRAFGSYTNPDSGSMEAFDSILVTLSGLDVAMGNTYELESLLLEKVSGTPDPYFDGDGPSDWSLMHRWMGDPYESVSVQADISDLTLVEMDEVEYLANTPPTLGDLEILGVWNGSSIDPVI